MFSNEIKRQVADTLRQSRVLRGLTHQELAQKIDVSADTIARIEQGKSVKLDAWLAVVIELGHGEDLMFALQNPKVTTIDQHQRLIKGPVTQKRVRKAANR